MINIVKKDNKEKNKNIIEKISDEDIVDVIGNNMVIYSSEVNMQRALPDSRDGLKPVNRRTLYSMWELGILSNKPHKKSARIVGDTMGKYHPHGDASIYEALVMLTQPFSMNLILVDGHGNFGNLSGDPAAAMRYTEARLSKYGELLVRELDDYHMVSNFDEEELEPLVLPVPLPIAIINGTMGIGWSVATNIAPHNPLEVMDGAIALAKNSELSAKKLSEIILGPDFPTGGEIIYSEEELLNDIKYGKAKYTCRGSFNIVDDKNHPYLEITAIPFKENALKLREKIINAIKDVKLFNYDFIEDKIVAKNDTFETSLKIRCKKGTSHETMERMASHIYKKTRMQYSFSVNNVMIDDGKLHTYGILKCLKIFNNFRLETLKKRWNKKLSLLILEKEVLEGKIKLYNVLDEIIELSKKVTERDYFKDQLINKYNFTNKQSESIVDTKLYQLGKIDINILTDKLNENINRTQELESFLSNEKLANQQLIKDLKETRELVKDKKRLTKIISPEEIKEFEEVKEEELIDEKEVVVVIKRDLKMFQIGAKAFENQIDSYKDDDIVYSEKTKNTNFVLGFTNNGQVVTRFINDLPSVSLENKINGLNKEIPELKTTSEFISGVCLSPNDKESNNRLLLMSNKGYVKSIDPVNLLPNVNRRTYVKKLTKIMSFNGKDKIAFIDKVTTNDLKNSTLCVTLLKPNKKETVRKRLMDKHFDRSDSGNSRGFKGVNTSDGEFKYISHILKYDEKNNEEQGEL